jgi:hypothetical protein
MQAETLYTGIAVANLQAQHLAQGVHSGLKDLRDEADLAQAQEWGRC